MRSSGEDDEEWDSHFQKRRNTGSTSNSELEGLRKQVARLEASQYQLMRENGQMREENEMVRRKLNALCYRLGVSSKLGQIEREMWND